MKLIIALVSRRWRWATVLVVLGVGILSRLGIWQLDRLAQRRAVNVQLEQVLHEPPLLITADYMPTDLPSLQDRLVIAQGEYDFAYQGIIKLQRWQGRAGVHVVAPLVLADGKTAILINRGWIPDDVIGQLADWNEPGQVAINGYVSLSQSLNRDRNNTAASAAELAWFRVDIDQIQAQLPYTLLPFYVIEWIEGEETADLPVPLPREIDLSEGSHLGYAIQWFTFSLMLGVGYLFLVRRSLDE